MITSLVLAAPLLLECWIPLDFQPASAHCWLTSHFSSPELLSPSQQGYSQIVILLVYTDYLGWRAKPCNLLCWISLCSQVPTFQVSRSLWMESLPSVVLAEQLSLMSPANLLSVPSVPSSVMIKVSKKVPRQMLEGHCLLLSFAWT